MRRLQFGQFIGASRVFWIRQCLPLFLHLHARWVEEDGYRDTASTDFWHLGYPVALRAKNHQITILQQQGCLVNGKDPLMSKGEEFRPIPANHGDGSLGLSHHPGTNSMQFQKCDQQDHILKRIAGVTCQRQVRSLWYTGHLDFLEFSFYPPCHTSHEMLLWKNHGFLPPMISTQCCSTAPRRQPDPQHISV